METATERICEACNAPYLYPEAEQDFRRSRGMASPILCPECRAEARSRRNTDILALYARADATDVWTEHPDRPRNSARNGTRQTYAAICADCGQETRVPFVPRGDRPVYCRTCYNIRHGK